MTSHGGKELIGNRYTRPWLVLRIGLLLLASLAATPARAQRVVIDGDLDEAFWRKTSSARLEPQDAGVPEALGGSVHCAIAGGYLYLGAVLPEPVGRIVARSIGKDPVWEGSEELRNEPIPRRPAFGAPEGEDYVRFTLRVHRENEWMVQVGPLGAYSVNWKWTGESGWSRSDPAQRDRFLVASRIEERGWNVEAAIPLDQIGSPRPEEIELTVLRNRALRPGTARETWAWPKDLKAGAAVPLVTGEQSTPSPVLEARWLGNPEPPLEIGFRKSLPALEESWSDPAWQGVPSWSLRRNEAAARLPRLPTEVKLIHDGHTLAILARCLESDDPLKVWHEYGRCQEMAKCNEPGSYLAQSEDRDGDISGDDSFQVYLATSGSYYVQYAINPLGNVLDAWGHQGSARLSEPHRQWNSPVRSRAWKGQGAWMVRFDLPLDYISKALGEERTPEDWRILLMRFRPGRDGEPQEVSTLPVTQTTTPFCPARYRRMRLVASDPSTVPIPISSDEKGSLGSLPGRVYSDEQRRQMGLPGMLDQYIRDRVRTMLEKEKNDWEKVHSVSDWEHFRDPRLQSLRKALGKFPATCPLETRVSSEYRGQGYRRQNLLFQSQPGIWVTANLYLPAEPREQMPGIIILHSLHAPKSQFELQDMGMIWARAGCAVLIIDQVGYGERSTTYPWDRDYFHSRTVEGEQLYLVGSSLLTWMVWDAIRGIDLLCERPDVNQQAIIVLGAVAGGGEPAGFAAAIDPRVAAVVPFSFGEAAPATARFIPAKNQWPLDLADPGLYDSDTTRDIRLNIVDQFLEWFVCASVAPRRFIYSFEVGWKVEDLPAWARYRKVFGLYDALDNLADAHGFGPMPGPGEAWNIGPAQRRRLYPTLQRWFGIPPPLLRETDANDNHTPETELCRRPAADLGVLTPEITSQIHMKALNEAAREQGQADVALVREKLATLAAVGRRKWLQTKWAEKLGNLDFNPRPAAKLEWTRQTANAKAEALALEIEPGITVPMLLLRPTLNPQRRQSVVVAVSEDGKELFLAERAVQIEDLLKAGTAVCLPDLRGTGETTPDFRRDPDGDEGMKANTVLMMGETLVGERLRDLRTVLAYLENRSDIDPQRIGLWGDSFWPSNPGHLVIDELPEWQIGPEIQSHAEPLGGLLALLGALYDDHVRTIAVHRGLVSFASLLDSNFSYVPQDVVVPGVLEVGDIADVAASLAPRALMIRGAVDGQDRLVPDAGLHHDLQAVFGAYEKVSPSALSIQATEGAAPISAWFLDHWQ